MTLASRDSTSVSSRFASAFASTLSPGFTTRYLTIFLSIFCALMSPLRRRRGGASELAVIAFLQRIEQVRCGVHLAVVLDRLVALERHLGAVLEREHVGRVLEVLLLDQYALKRLRVEAEGGAALEPLLVRVEVDVLEVVVAVVGGHVRGLGDRRVHPLLRRRLDVHVLARRDVVGGREVLRQLLGGRGGARH